MKCYSDDNTCKYDDYARPCVKVTSITDFGHRSEFEMARKHNVPETKYLSFFRREELTSIIAQTREYHYSNAVYCHCLATAVVYKVVS
jgi:hypothetical protein